MILHQYNCIIYSGFTQCKPNDGDDDVVDVHDGVDYDVDYVVDDDMSWMMML